MDLKALWAYLDFSSVFADSQCPFCEANCDQWAEKNTVCHTRREFSGSIVSSEDIVICTLHFVLRTSELLLFNIKERNSNVDFSGVFEELEINPKIYQTTKSRRWKCRINGEEADKILDNFERFSHLHSNPEAFNEFWGVIHKAFSYVMDAKPFYTESDLETVKDSDIPLEFRNGNVLYMLSKSLLDSLRAKEVIPVAKVS